MKIALAFSVRHRRNLGWLIASILVLTLSGCGKLQQLVAPPTEPPPEGTSKTVHGPAYAPGNIRQRQLNRDADWLAYNNTRAGNRFVALDAISTANVASLQRACVFQLEDPVNMQSALVEVAGTLYFTTLDDTYAIDATNCKLRWRHIYHLARHPTLDPNKVNRGVAYLDGRLFRGSNDGRLYALNAATGEELWNVAIGDPSTGETFPAAPQAWDGRVFIGNAGGDYFGVTGRMMAFDAGSGKQLWSIDLVPTAGPASQTWPPSTPVKPKTGAATWTSYAVDTDAGLIYVPTGNAAPDFLKSVRPGKNLYTYSVVGLDMRNGSMRYARQLLRADMDWHDWDMAAPPELIDTPDGRHLLVQAGKDGYLYVVDRDTDKLLYKTPVAKIKNALEPMTVAGGGTHFCPGIMGGVEWNGPAYSPATNAFYVNAINWCTTVKIRPPDKLEPRKGLFWTGAKSRAHPFGQQDPQSGWSGWVTAVDAADGSILWRHRASAPFAAGITATAGGLVFTANLAGQFMALDARTGAVLWRRNTGQPIGGGVISYGVDGKQYVAVASGMNSPTSWQLSSSPAKIVVFALPCIAQTKRWPRRSTDRTEILDATRIASARQ
ncbi:MAG TPA: PQQ-binding-like beta-propeller repeat protein [Gammaproteobacteria bacterium]|nr:PQQ-binding-like beta-propeller repeat protein [Gammaproteobacteria bacterium]